MNRLLVSAACSALLVTLAVAAPASEISSSVSIVASSSIASTAPAPSETVPLASDDPNAALWNADTTIVPQAIRGSLGATILGPQNIDIDRQNADFLAPPTTDAGDIPNAKITEVMPIATSMAGVNMRLEAGAIRELHWHKTAEWSFVISGFVQLTAVDSEGQNFLETVGPGDLWYFPPGIPHSLQATNESADGAEFLLVFDDGAFSEDSTFLLTDWMSHIPKEVIAKNFQTNISAFDHIPGQQLYIFPSAPPPENAVAPEDPQGHVPNPFTFKLSQVKATPLSGGSVKVVDSSTFTIATEIAVADITVEPGAIRELHWHPTQDEWTYYLSGLGRVTLFGAQGNSRTFDYEPGDVGFVPASFGHFVENIGNTTLHFLEIFNSDRFQDISLAQWLALTPPALVKAHLQLDDDTIDHLNKTKQIVVGPQ
ncbi:Oxalate decarboxylase OxdC [Grifola frondosa]|uniref:Oxalate decarboxylase OxdC n=1 Tax=Grifola frondosa TaxID=5627 RepID=A0A1C7M6J8_GRIFR|nr:Oxalate decarboxylase OxdC [Grifola frondosa]